MINSFIKMIIIYFIYNATFASYLPADIFIQAKIDNEVVTNFDIKKEQEYLMLLNPNLVNLEKSQLFDLSKNSLITEIIKKKEIQKNFNKIDLAETINENIENFYKNLKFENEELFKKALALNPNNYSFDEIKEKINIELKWNELIYKIYQNQVAINKEKLLAKINEIETIREYNLSEIIFVKKKNKKLNDLIEEIYLSIDEIGFENSSIIYSLSSSSKIGGSLGWIKENNLSKKILDNLNKTKVNEITEAIQIGNNFIILKLHGIRNSENKIDKKKELQKLIFNETNNQLNRFSRIYFDKIKLNYVINE